jgi:hypothetical protein
MTVLRPHSASKSDRLTSADSAISALLLKVVRNAVQLPLASLALPDAMLAGLLEAGFPGGDEGYPPQSAVGWSGACPLIDEGDPASVGRDRD